MKSRTSLLVALVIGLTYPTFTASPASAQVKPAVASISISQSRWVLADSGTKHVVVTVMLTAPAWGLSSLRINPLDEFGGYETDDYTNPSGDLVTWVEDISFCTTCGTPWGTSRFASFSAWWDEDPSTGAGRHSADPVTSPAASYTVQAATRLAISRSRKVHGATVLIAKGILLAYGQDFSEVSYTGVVHSKVQLQAHRPGKPWHVVATVKGVVGSHPASWEDMRYLSYPVALRHTTYYRWVYKEAAATKGAVSNTMKVTII
jgi:hypothetical protein